MTQKSLAKIIFPEAENENIIAATKSAKLRQICQPWLEKMPLEKAFNLVKKGEADALIAGIENTTRALVLASWQILGLKQDEKTFGSFFVAKLRDGRELMLTDGGVTKNPSAEQLADTTWQSIMAAQKIWPERKIRAAMLSFSTFGSGGEDASITKIQDALKLLHAKKSEREKASEQEILIEGEMQLDVAINATVGQKKAPQSQVAGKANLLVVPDLNAGNILYKAMEQFAGAVVAGPILTGFKAPVSDLSRGSSLEDVIFTTECLVKLLA